MENFDPYALRYVNPVDDLAIERYGEYPGFEVSANPIIDHMLMHRSVRHFTGEPVTDEHFRTAMAAAQSAATSSHLQSWSVIKVSNPRHKFAINELCGDQGHIATAPLMLIWVADQSRNYAIGKREGTSQEAFEFFEATMLGIVDSCLAAQNAALAFEAMGYGTCFIGAVRNNATALGSMLNLPDRCAVVVGMVVGRPLAKHLTDVKPRLSQDVVVHEEVYHTAPAIAIKRYDDIMDEFQRRQWMRSVKWSSKVAMRLSVKAALTGREHYMEYLASTSSGVR